MLLERTLVAFINSAKELVKKVDDSLELVINYAEKTLLERIVLSRYGSLNELIFKNDKDLVDEFLEGENTFILVGGVLEMCLFETAKSLVTLKGSPETLFYTPAIYDSSMIGNPLLDVLVKYAFGRRPAQGIKEVIESYGGKVYFVNSEKPF